MRLMTVSSLRITPASERRMRSLSSQLAHFQPVSGPPNSSHAVLRSLNEMAVPESRRVR